MFVEVKGDWLLVAVPGAKIAVDDTGVEEVSSDIECELACVDLDELSAFGVVVAKLTPAGTCSLLDTIVLGGPKVDDGRRLINHWENGRVSVRFHSSLVLDVRYL